MADGPALLDLLIPGVAIGLCLAFAMAIVQSRLSWTIRFCAFLAASSYAVNILYFSPFERLLGLQYGGPWIAAALFGGLPAAFTWASIIAVFEDGTLRWRLLTPALISLMLACVDLSGTGSLQTAAWRINNLFLLLLVLNAFYVLARGYAGDLVESRRRLRRPLLAACVLMGLVQVFVYVIYQTRWADQGPWLARSGNLLELIGLCAFVAVVLQLRGGLFTPPPARAGPDADRDEDDIAALNAIMLEGEAWRREGLGIGKLAAELKMPEHRLRRLINGRLGHRNFRAFLNAYRIEAARRRLADPHETRSIAQIAFDLGFTSLSPFNRAFKEAVGDTPNEWRRRTSERDGEGIAKS